jgi:Fe-S oxidoreductase
MPDPNEENNLTIESEKLISPLPKSMVQSCNTCGQCISKCFLSRSYPEINPRKIIDKIKSGSDQDVIDSEFIWACTLCGRCTTDCPKDIQMDSIIRHLRGKAWVEGKAPARIVEGVKKAIEYGNNTGLESEAFIDMAEWMLEELVDEMEDPPEEELTLPVDKEGAEILYIPNPREYTSNPNMFQTYIKFFMHTNADWTISSKTFDITNWAYYIGDHTDSIELIRNMVNTARELKVKILLSTECGHGFKILRKDAENWLGEPLGFEVLSIVELAYKYLQNGKLMLPDEKSEAKITYHDPCNVGRKLGIFEEPRALLKAVTNNFVELWPNQKYGLCCGGGGSVGQNTDMGRKRLEYAERKRDQILSSEAEILATSCQNCLSQLSDIQSRYEMPLEVKSVIEVVMDHIESANSEE